MPSYDSPNENDIRFHQCSIKTQKITSHHELKENTLMLGKRNITTELYCAVWVFCLVLILISYTVKPSIILKPSYCYFKDSI